MVSRVHRFRHFAAVWVAVEQFLFGGLFFGWGSLVFVLKDEGIYSFLCKSDNETNSEVISQNVSKGNTTVSTAGEKQAFCPKQDSRLNLWFTIATSVLFMVEFFCGILIFKFGQRIVRIFGVFAFTFGSLCIAFVDNSAPWLLLPGIFTLGVGGVISIATATAVIPIQFKRLSSSIASLLSGCFNSASLVNLLVKIVYERNGISRRTSYIFLTVLQVIMVSFSTFFFFEKRRSSKKNEDEGNDRNIQDSTDVSETPTEFSAKTKEGDKPRPLKCYLFSSLFILHILWFSFHFFHMISFIGLVNTWIEEIFKGDNDQVSHLTDVFSYMTTCAFPLTVIGGIFLDWQRMLFKDASSAKRRILFPGAICLGISTGFGLLTSILKLFSTPKNIYASFVFFVVFREFLSAQGIAMLIVAFPIKYFGLFYGIMFGASGLISLLQYGIFTWAQSYSGGELHANIFFVCLEVVLFVHPANMFAQAWRGTGDAGVKRKEYDLSEAKNRTAKD